MEDGPLTGMMYKNTLIVITIELIGQVGCQVIQTEKGNVSMLSSDVSGKREQALKIRQNTLIMITIEFIGPEVGCQVPLECHRRKRSMFQCSTVKIRSRAENKPP